MGLHAASRILMRATAQNLELNRRLLFRRRSRTTPKGSI